MQQWSTLTPISRDHTFILPASRAGIAAVGMASDEADRGASPLPHAPSPKERRVTFNLPIVGAVRSWWSPDPVGGPIAVKPSDGGNEMDGANAGIGASNGTPGAHSGSGDTAGATSNGHVPENDTVSELLGRSRRDPRLRRPGKPLPKFKTYKYKPIKRKESKHARMLRLALDRARRTIAKATQVAERERSSSPLVVDGYEAEPEYEVEQVVDKRYDYKVHRKQCFYCLF